jgi:hypothetical protein
MIAGRCRFQSLFRFSGMTNATSCRHLQLDCGRDEAARPNCFAREAKLLACFIVVSGCKMRPIRSAPSLTIGTALL